MAATRKLQGEIDRCLKKVAEGVDTFEDIWQKVHNATNSNQKEKYEADLKKEIKKLQRLRDQIKAWIASAEIKDKSALVDNRRLIETQMERFKVVERETKTKAYSKEGLGAAQKLDPAQRIKDEVRQWITQAISNLQIQVELYESKMESLVAGKKKRLDRDKQDRMDDIKSKFERHKYHIAKLETLLRMLDNDTVDVEQVRNIKEDVEYYVDSSQEPDFEENVFMYDEIIGLDEVEQLAAVIPSTTDSNNSNDTGDSPSSLISGSSPVTSPTNMNCGFNHVSESTSVEFGEKKNKNENLTIGSKVTPVKPTAVRANKPEINSTVNNNITSSAPSKTVCSTPNKNQSHTASPAIANNNSTQQNVSSGAPTIPLSTSTTSITTSSNSSSSGGIVTIQNQLPLAVSAAATAAAVSSRDENHSHANKTISTRDQQPLQNSIIPTTAPVAFAAVAKHSSSQHTTNEGQLYSAFASPAISTATSHSNQTAAHQTSSVINSSQQQSNAENGAVRQSNIQNNNTSCSNNVVTSQHQTNQGLLASVTSGSNASNALDSHTIFTSITNNNLTTTSTSINNSITNSVSPTNSIITSALGSLKQPQLVPNSLANSDSMSTLKTIAQEAVNRATGLDNNSILSSSNLQATATSLVSTLTDNRVPLFSNDSTMQTNGPHSGVSNHNNNAINANSLLKTNIIGTGTNEAHIPPLLGVAPLGPCPLKKEHQLQFQMMEASEYHLPEAMDSERVRKHLIRRPVQTPVSYPQTQLPHSDTFEFFQRLSTETLFFIFYYMEGTKAQFLAAKALKKQSWRFHTKYMMWFQRHEEPKLINEDYEQGTYIYFDYEKWGQRKKEGFTFEYRYLEDRDLN